MNSTKMLTGSQAVWCVLQGPFANDMVFLFSETSESSDEDGGSGGNEKTSVGQEIK